MSRTPLQAFIDQQVPPAKRALLPAALRRAYGTVDQLYKDEPLFQVETAKQARGHVVALAVDMQVERLIKSGDWPYDFKWESFSKPTGRYLKVFLPSATMSVSQVPDKWSVPRNARFRHNHALNNQLLLDYPEFEAERRVSGMPHLILAHGYQDLTFSQVGIPHHRKAVWLDKTENILEQTSIVESDLPQAEGGDEDFALSIKEEIERWKRDNNV